MSVHRKLMQARIELQSKSMSKSGLNKFAGYSYFELGDFLPSVMEIFNGIGLCGVISFAPDVATLTITDVDGGGEIKITSPMADANLKGAHPIQNLGAVESYTRRYLWLAAMEIVEHDALDATAGKGAPRHSPTQGAMDSLPPDQQEYLAELAATIIGLVDAGEAVSALDKVNAEQLDSEQMTALWSRLDSKTRSAIKAAKGK